MTALETRTRMPALAPADQREQRLTPQTPAQPIVAAADGSTASKRRSHRGTVLQDGSLRKTFLHRGPIGTEQVEELGCRSPPR
jgi:hypothetical protein